MHFYSYLLLAARGMFIQNDEGLSDSRQCLAQGGEGGSVR